MKKITNYILAGIFGMFMSTAIAEELPPDPPGKCPYSSEEFEDTEERANGFCYAWNRIMLDQKFEIRFTFKEDYTLMINFLPNCICGDCERVNTQMTKMMSEQWWEAIGETRAVQCWTKSGVLLMYVNSDGEFFLSAGLM